MATREQTSLAPDSVEGVINRALTRAYTLNWEAIAYAVILVLALLTRFVDLGARVMSHDESLHTYYSWRLYEFGEFSHTPLMHGPLLFHMTALSYFLFGDNDFTSRIYPALLGVLIVMFPLLFRRWLGRVGAVITAVLLLISPQLLYYNRYIRHDTPTIFFALLMLLALLNYVDGRPPRRATWLWVLSAALLGMLASKEVAFIYIALFGSYLTLYWLMRIGQDVGIQHRPADRPVWRAPLLQLAAGHLILLAGAGITAVLLGSIVSTMLSARQWVPPLELQLLLFGVLYGPLAASGMLRTLLAGEPRDGVATAIMRGMSHGRSALYVILAGVILGAVLGLWITCVLDIIKPEVVWTPYTVLSEHDSTYGVNGTKEYARAISFDEAMFVRLLTWVGLPVLLALFVVFLTAVFRFPGHISLPWRELLLLILITLIVTAVVVAAERHSFVEETASQPWAVDPNAPVVMDGGGYNRTPLVLSWLAAVIVVSGVVVTRLFTTWWDFFNRQPVFDVLIVIGTLILPWLSAFPLYWAGYNLEDYNPGTREGRDTLNAALGAFVPFLLVAVAIGLAWNWKRWLPAAAIFFALFVFFFTTVFSNQYGLATGMVGSLGYWLAQQGVRRGSQPQYYYVLTQLPVYEFLPLIGAMLAGVSGFSWLWRWRYRRIDSDRQARIAAEQAQIEAEAAAESAGDVPEFTRDLPDTLPEQEPVKAGTESRRSWLPARLTRPFDADEDSRRSGSDPEWIEAIPFLGLAGYWSIMILVALTMAGEKMPWLTTHLTVPLILVTGWWLGRVVMGVQWRALRGGGWLALMIAMPLALTAQVHVILALWGSNPPFRGRTTDQLAATGNWFAALLVAFFAFYVVVHLGRRVGRAQLGRMVIVSGALILAVLTARMAFLAVYINHDYATETLVYAHAGPAIKTVMNEVDRIATITNQGSAMRVVFDDESSWPYSWYFRHYTNYGLLRGEAGSVNPSDLDGARVVVVGNKKVGDVRRILGDRYYEFSYIRLWWPMQEYFHLNYQRVANVFSTDPNNVAARYYRQGLFNIWFNRDYSVYGQAMCIEDRQRRCEGEAQWGQTPEEQDRYRRVCQSAVVTECRGDQRFDVSRWPVSDRMYFFVDKEVAAQVWDAGIGGASVDIREPQYPEDRVFLSLGADSLFGQLAGMRGPRGVAVDEDGLIYVVDTDHNRVVIFNQDGQQTGMIGYLPDGTSEPGSLKQPWGIDIGPDGRVYIADTWNHRIQVFNRSGELLAYWGHEGVMPGDLSVDALWGPRDVKVGPDGNVYVADTGNKRVRVYTPDGEFVRDIGSAGSALGQLDEPVGLAFNPVSGDLYVAEAWNKRIQVFNRDGLPVRAWDVNMWFRNRQSYDRPYLAVSPDGTLVLVGDMNDRHRVVAYNLNGMPIYAFNQPDNLEVGMLGMRAPAGLAFDPQGRLVVVDSELAQVFVFRLPAEITGGIAPVPVVSPEQTEEATEEATPDAAEEVAPEEVAPAGTEEPAE